MQLAHEVACQVTLVGVCGQHAQPLALGRVTLLGPCARIPDGPERAALFLKASQWVCAYMPYRIHVHRIYTDLNQAWVTGWRQAAFRNEGWQYVSVDAALRERLPH